MNLVCEPRNDKQNYVVCISVSRGKGKIIWKDMSKLFFQNYHYHYVKVKCCRNVDWSFNRKNRGFWVLWGIFKDYIKQNIIMEVFWKTNSHSVVICRLIKKVNVRDTRSEEKNWFKHLFFPSYLALMRF